MVNGIQSLILGLDIVRSDSGLEHTKKGLILFCSGADCGHDRISRLLVGE